MSTVKEKFDIIISMLDAINMNLRIGEFAKESTGIDYSEVSEHGGIRLEEVEKIRAEWLAKGGNYAKVAKQLSKWWCFLDPNITYSVEIERQIEANQGRVWRFANEENVWEMYKMKPLFENVKTGKVKWTYLTRIEYWSGNWKENKDRRDGVIKNHSIIANGEFSSPNHPRWQTELRDRIGEFVERKMNKDYGNLIRS